MVGLEKNSLYGRVVGGGGDGWRGDGWLERWFRKLIRRTIQLIMKWTEST